LEQLSVYLETPQGVLLKKEATKRNASGYEHRPSIQKVKTLPTPPPVLP